MILLCKQKCYSFAFKALKNYGDGNQSLHFRVSSCAASSTLCKYGASGAIFLSHCLIYKCVLQCCCGIFEIASSYHAFFSLVFHVLCAICIEFLLLLTEISPVLIPFLRNKHLIQTKQSDYNLTYPIVVIELYGLDVAI